MLRMMLAGSRAVLLRPSVATFQAHEREQTGWALLYVTLGATISAIIGVVGFFFKQPFLERQNAIISARLREFEGTTGFNLLLEHFFAPQTAADPIVSSMFGTLISFLSYLAITYMLGRALGGTGRFSALAYDMALYWVPITVFSALLDLFTVSFFACCTAPLVMFAAAYGFYLTFLSMQAGLELPPGHALVVVIVPAVLYLLVIGALFLLAFIVTNLAAS